MAVAGNCRLFLSLHGTNNTARNQSLRESEHNGMEAIFPNNKYERTSMPFHSRIIGQTTNMRVHQSPSTLSFLRIHVQLRKQSKGRTNIYIKQTADNRRKFTTPLLLLWHQAGWQLQQVKPVCSTKKFKSKLVQVFCSRKGKGIYLQWELPILVNTTGSTISFIISV